MIEKPDKPNAKLRKSITVDNVETPTPIRVGEEQEQEEVRIPELKLEDVQFDNHVQFLN